MQWLLIGGGLALLALFLRKTEQGLAEVVPGVNGKPGSIKYPDGTVKNGGPASWRANNPGNITYSEWAVKNGAFPGAKQGWGAKKADGTWAIYFAVFPSEAAGFACLLALLRTPQYANLSIAKAMERYLGWTDGKPPAGSVDNPQAYADALATAVGKPLATVLNTLSGVELEKLAKRIQGIEGWTAAGPDGKPGTVTRG